LYNSNFVFLRRAVFTIFDIEKMSWPWNGVKDHWEWYHSIDCVCFLIVFFSNFVHKMHRFWDIRLQTCRDLENRVRGLSRSLEVSPCDRAHMTFYWRSIVGLTMALCRVVSEIFNVEKCRDLEIGVRGHSRSLKVVPFGRSCMLSLKVIENSAMQSGAHDFLLTFHSNHQPVSHRFRDKRRYPLKIARKSPTFATPVYLSPPLKGFAVELCIDAGDWRN